MNKQWIESKKEELLNEAEKKRTEIVETINSSSLLSEKDKQDVIAIMDCECGKESYNLFEPAAILKIFNNHDDDEAFSGWFMEMEDFIRGLDTDAYNSILYKVNGGLDKYLDSEPMEFDGDIIITDPCYIIREKHHGTTPITDDDWCACDYGSHMETLGIQHYMTSDTLYGDWGCTVYDTDTDEVLGEFCADAGLVSVFLLGEVLKYNPDFDYHKERTWTTTLIPNFKGTVQFVIEHHEGVFEDTTEYHKAGDKWEDYSLHVAGNGIDKKTGGDINFYSTQTSM